MPPVFVKLTKCILKAILFMINTYWWLFSIDCNDFNDFFPQYFLSI